MSSVHPLSSIFSEDMRASPGLFKVDGERLISEEVRAKGWTHASSVCDNAGSEGERDSIA